MSCNARGNVEKPTRRYREFITKAQPCKDEANGVWTNLDQDSITASSNWATSTQTSKAANIRADFNTPEARHGFCLSAFRPSLDTEENFEFESDSSNASSIGIDDEQHALSISPKLGFSRGYSLQRTDKPVTDSSLFVNAPPKQCTASSEQHASLHKAPQSDLPHTSSLRADELWGNVGPSKVLNPFEGHPNDAGFFACYRHRMPQRG